MKPPLQEKYDWLCAKFLVRGVDAYEQDAFLGIRSSLGMYFQFPAGEVLPISVDRAIVLAMQETNQT